MYLFVGILQKLQAEFKSFKDLVYHSFNVTIYSFYLKIGTLAGKNFGTNITLNMLLCFNAKFTFYQILGKIEVILSFSILLCWLQNVSL